MTNEKATAADPPTPITGICYLLTGWGLARLVRRMLARRSELVAVA